MSRLRSYLVSTGLPSGADEQAMLDHLDGLEGLERAIANALDYDESKPASRSLADLQLRALGVNPENPSEMLERDDAPDDDSSTGARGKSKQGRAANPPPADHDYEAAVERALAKARKEEKEQKRAREKAVRELGAEHELPEDVIEAAVRGDMDLHEAGRHFLRHIRSERTGVSFDMSGAPAGHSRNSRSGYTKESLAFAVMMGRCGIEDPTSHYRSYNPHTEQCSRAINIDQIEDQKQRDTLRSAIDMGSSHASLSMMELVARCYRLDGIACEPTIVSIEQAARQARSAAPGGATLTFAFSTAFHAAMMQGHDLTPDTTQGWVEVDTNSDFTKKTVGRMKEGGVLTKHARGGQADQITMEDTAETTKVDRYSARFVIDDMDLIDNRFGNLRQAAPSEMGESARQLRPDMVYAGLMSNPTLASDSTAMFHVNHGNIGSGALSKDNIQALVTRLMTQTEGGRNLQMRPYGVIAPTTKAFALAEILEPMAMIAAGGGSNERMSAYNALAQYGLKPIHDNRLDNGVVDPDTGVAVAGNLNRYYVVGTRSMLRVSYLTGSSRSPVVRFGLLDNGQWGIWWDVKMDIGFDPIGYQGIVTSPGT